MDAYVQPMEMQPVEQMQTVVMPCEYFLDLEQTWFEVRSYLGGSGGSRFGFGEGSRFGFFRFVPIPKEKFTHFLIFYEVKTFGLVRSSVSEDEPRFGRFEVRFS